MNLSELKECAESRGWEHAAFADAYEGGFCEESDIPVEGSISIPYYAEHEPNVYRGAFQDGCRKFIENNAEDDEEPSDPWPYAEDNRER